MGRTPSQNVFFVGSSSGDDVAEPPGRGIAKAIVSRLRAEKFDATDEDNWRDCGWSIKVVMVDTEIEIALARAGNDQQWIAQVAPNKEPGVFAQLFGRKFVDRSAEVLALSRSIHCSLQESQY